MVCHFRFCISAVLHQNNRKEKNKYGSGSYITSHTGPDIASCQSCPLLTAVRYCFGKQAFTVLRSVKIVRALLHMRRNCASKTVLALFSVSSALARWTRRKQKQVIESSHMSHSSSAPSVVTMCEHMSEADLWSSCSAACYPSGSELTPMDPPCVSLLLPGLTVETPFIQLTYLQYS